MRGGVNQQRVAVGIGFGDQRRAKAAAGAAAIFNNDGLPDLARQRVRDDAADNVAASAWVMRVNAGAAKPAAASVKKRRRLLSVMVFPPKLQATNVFVGP